MWSCSWTASSKLRASECKQPRLADFDLDFNVYPNLPARLDLGMLPEILSTTTSGGLLSIRRNILQLCKIWVGFGFWARTVARF